MLTMECVFCRIVKFGIKVFAFGFFPIEFDFRINSRVSMSLPFNLFPKEPHIGSFINILEYRCHVFVVCSVMFILEFAFSFSYISFMNSKPCLWDDPRLTRYVAFGALGREGV